MLTKSSGIIAGIPLLMLMTISISERY